MRLSQYKNRRDRIRDLRGELKIDLGSIDKAFSDDENKVHCENLIGAITLPLGIAGPLKVKNLPADRQGEKVTIKNYYIPLATTEGALVASVNRGCKAITVSGGANVSSYKIGATRGPVFFTGSLRKSRELYLWMKKNEKHLALVAEKTSKHLTFKKFDIRTLANYAYIRFYFDTQDAMGMNMVTIATEKIVQFIEKETGISCLSLAGNFDTDKKPAWINFINNRGIKTWAEIVLAEDILADVFKINAQKLFDVWLAKNMIGSAMAGSMGFNAHFANIGAAFFAATGQDLAHVTEASMGMTTANVINSDLYFSVYLPDLMIGTVGGGTNLKTQSEALSIIGVKKSAELAEVLTAAILAGELSLLASLTEGSLAQAHETLGRL